MKELVTELQLRAISLRKQNVHSKYLFFAYKAFEQFKFKNHARGSDFWFQSIIFVEHRVNKTVRCVKMLSTYTVF